MALLLHAFLYGLALFFSLSGAYRLSADWPDNAALLEKLQDGETPMKPMSGLYTANKFEYDARPGDPAAGEDYADTMTVIEVLEAAAKKYPNKNAFYMPRQDAKGNLIKKSLTTAGIGRTNLLNHRAHHYLKYTWKQYRDLVFEFAASLISMGLQPMDAVQIRGPNTPEWLIAFMGTIAAGGLPVGLYPTDAKDVMKYKAQDSGAAFAVLAKVKDLKAYASFIGEIPTLKGILLYDGYGNPETIDADVSLPVYRFQLEKKNGTTGTDKYPDFLSKGKECEDCGKKALKRASELKPGQATTVVYTSGTTGNPKGVMLTHDNFYYAGQNVMRTIEVTEKMHHRTISFLPLNHVAGQLFDIYAPMFVSAKVAGSWVSIYFAATCYLKKTCSLQQLTDTKPTMFLAVPLVWDGLRTKLETSMKESAIAKGLADNLPSFLRSKIGFGAVKIALTGAGPITKDTLMFYKKLGINILNLFGQSESSALGTGWRPSDYKRPDLNDLMGSIGAPDGGEFKIGDPDEKGAGEILLRGRHVMLGYLNRAEKNEETITADGWLKTGDKARQDARSKHVFLVGRFKEIMKDYGGEMIAPTAVEEGILAACTKDDFGFLKQAIVQGDGYYYLSVLVAPLEGEDEEVPNGKLVGAAKSIDPAATTVAEAKKSPIWAKTLADCIGAYNKKAQKGPERVWRYYMMDHMITDSDSDLMTPTKKLKRGPIAEKFEEVVKSQCGGAPEGGAVKMTCVGACGSEC